MLESVVELLNGLTLVALILLMVISIVGSIVAALRAVSRGTATSESIQGRCVDEIQLFDEQFTTSETSPNAVFSGFSLGWSDNCRRPRSD